MSKVIHDVAFRVPNNREGNKFISQCRKYVNRDKYSRVLARPRSGERTDWGETIREGCKSFAVYLAHSPRHIQNNYDRQAKNYVHFNQYEQDMDKRDKIHNDDMDKLLKEYNARINSHKLKISNRDDTITALNSIIKESQKWVRTYKISMIIIFGLGLVSTLIAGFYNA